MKNNVLAEKIYQMALECGFDNCGIIPVSDIDGYQQRLTEREEKVPSSVRVYRQAEEFSKIKETYPWAKSIVICTIWLGKYRYPISLQGKYAKSFMLSEDTVPDCKEHQKKLRFEQWMNEQGIQFKGGETGAPARILPLRHAAVTAGLGIFRKNNFFYAEKGSYYGLEGYIIDQECEYKHSCDIKPCSDKCTLCQKACKTKALFAPYTMDPISCISFLTTFGQGNIPPHLKEKQLGTWICGCDDCQDACPYNRHDWENGVDFSGLNAITELLHPDNILEASDVTLCEKVIPKTDKHIKNEQVHVLRKSAARVLRHLKNTGEL